MRISVRLQLLTLLALSIVALAACSKPPKGSGLPGVVYGSQIPVYPSAVFEDSMGGNYYETIGGPVTYESLSWFFKVSDPMDKVVAFYATRLPHASRSEDEETGEQETEASEAEEEEAEKEKTDQQETKDVRLAFVPVGAEEGEDVTIHISPGKLQITEVVKPGKRKA
jgi:hypothetical protein